MRARSRGLVPACVAATMLAAAEAEEKVLPDGTRYEGAFRDGEYIGGSQAVEGTTPGG